MPPPKLTVAQLLAGKRGPRVRPALPIACHALLANVLKSAPVAPVPRQFSRPPAF